MKEETVYQGNQVIKIVTKYFFSLNAGSILGNGVTSLPPYTSYMNNQGPT